MSVTLLNRLTEAVSRSLPHSGVSAAAHLLSLQSLLLPLPVTALKADNMKPAVNSELKVRVE